MIMWDIVALCAALVLLGIAVGMLIGRKYWRWVDRVMYEPAPVPATLGYDPENPMNAGRGRETVEVGGATWYIVR